MPSHLLPRKSGVHRIACKALYRALLEQCQSIPLPADLPSRGPVHLLKHFVRKKFRQNVYHTSHAMVVRAMKTGYAAEQLLHSANTGNLSSLTQIHTLLRLHSSIITFAQENTPKPIPRIRPPRPEAYPGAAKVLETRPLPLSKISKTRHVPSLALTANARLAFLRFKKRQSPYLSRVLRQKMEKQMRRFEVMEKLERDLEVVDQEKEWEDIVLDQLDEEGGPEEKWEEKEGRNWGVGWERWSGFVEYKRRGVGFKVANEIESWKETGRKMMAIVEEEEKLWKEERSWRRHEKLEAKKAAKRLALGITGDGEKDRSILVGQGSIEDPGEEKKVVYQPMNRETEDINVEGTEKRNGSKWQRTRTEEDTTTKVAGEGKRSRYQPISREKPANKSRARGL